jgi:hypothetical protein
MPKKCSSCSNEAENGKLQCPFHLAKQNWYTRRSYLRSQGKNESDAGPMPEIADFNLVLFVEPKREAAQAKEPPLAQVVRAVETKNGKHVKSDVVEEQEGRERVEFSKEHDKRIADEPRPTSSVAETIKALRPGVDYRVSSSELVERRVRKRLESVRKERAALEEQIEQLELAEEILASLFGPAEDVSA